MVKYLLAGADVVMSASALIRHGPGYAAVLLDGLSGWMDRKGYLGQRSARSARRARGHRSGGHERSGYVRAMRDANGFPW